MNVVRAREEEVVAEEEKGGEEEDDKAQGDEKSQGLPGVPPLPSTTHIGRGRGGKGLGKWRRVGDPAAVSQRRQARLAAAAGPPPDYNAVKPFMWSQVANIGGGGQIGHLTGIAGSINYCDEEVDDELIEEGQQLLGEFEAVPEWFEHDETSRTRRDEVEHGFVTSCGPLEGQRMAAVDGGAKLRVFYSSPLPAQARFEITYLAFDDSSIEYAFMVDRRDREFVFVGVIGAHPHCGTAHFSYDNSDGSGPNLFEDEEEEAGEEEEEEEAEAAAIDPTMAKKDRVEAPSPEQRVAAGTAFVVARLLPAAKLRFHEFCHNLWH